MGFASFLRLNNILLYVWPTFFFKKTSFSRGEKIRPKSLECCERTVKEESSNKVERLRLEKNQERVRAGNQVKTTF